MTWLKTVETHKEANFLQSPEWGRTNELIGATVITEEFENHGRALMIVRKAKRGRYLEIPCGPLIDWQNKKLAKSALEHISKIAKTHRCTFVRIRPQLLFSDQNLKLLKSLGARIAPMHLAAEHTVIINLKPSEEELLKNMRRQTRYEVRRAEKQGIIVEKSHSEDDFRTFHRVQIKTAKRQNFIPPDLKTLLAEHQAFGPAAKIYTAKTADGEPIAYGLILKNANEAAYFEAASTDLNRKLPGAYALIWQAIKDLKAENIERFNLWGIAPKDQPHHRYAGVTTFKTGFGGEVVEYVPAHDLVLNELAYLKTFLIETIRKKRRHL